MADHPHTTPTPIAYVTADTPIPSRRRTLFAAAGAAVIGAAAGLADQTEDASADADLIAICIKAQAIDDRSMALIDATGDMLPSDPKWSPAVDESARLFSECKKHMTRVATVLAATPDGLRAKASLALREMTPTDCEDFPLVFSVLSQVAGRA